MARVSRCGPKKSCKRKVDRRGAYLVLFALSMTLFLGFLALIHDLALINYGWRRCQNIADAAALAGARKLGSTRSPSIARDTALTYLTILNPTDSRLADIRTPPTSDEVLLTAKPGRAWGLRVTRLGSGMNISSPATLWAVTSIDGLLNQDRRSIHVPISRRAVTWM